MKIKAIAMSSRQKPNILVTGTPGTGKTTTCELLAEATGLKHINIGDLVKKEELHTGWDEEYKSYVIDEDKVGVLLIHFRSFCPSPSFTAAATINLQINPSNRFATP